MSETNQSTSMLGWPIVYSDKVPTLGGTGDLVLLPLWVELHVTTAEAIAIRNAINLCERTTPEYVEAMDISIAEILGPERTEVLAAARRNGQYVHVKVGESQWA